MLSVGKYDVKERDESKSQHSAVVDLVWQVGKYDVKERDESKSQPLTGMLFITARWQI